MNWDKIEGSWKKPRTAAQKKKKVTKRARYRQNQERATHSPYDIAKVGQKEYPGE